MELKCWIDYKQEEHHLYFIHPINSLKTPFRRMRAFFLENYYLQQIFIIFPKLKTFLVPAENLKSKLKKHFYQIISFVALEQILHFSGFWWNLGFFQTSHRFDRKTPIIPTYFRSSLLQSLSVAILLVWW